MAEFATVARPYAKAIYSLAEQHKKLNPWLKKLSVIAEVVRNPKVATALSQPELNAQERANILLSTLTSERLDAQLKNFILVLAENDRLSVLPEIAEQYRVLALSQEQTQQATVYSAFPLAGKELDDLVALLEKKLNTKLQVEVQVDPELIGGVKVEFGDQVLDMSVQSKLSALYATIIN